MKTSSGYNITESDRMKKLLGKARLFRSSQLLSYKLSDEEETELRSLVIRRVPFLRDASMDAIIDNGLLLVGFDSIIARLENEEEQEMAKI